MAKWILRFFMAGVAAWLIMYSSEDGGPVEAIIVAIVMVAALTLKDFLRQKMMAQRRRRSQTPEAQTNEPTKQ